MKKSVIEKGFILSGLVNILGILGFSRFFTNTVIPETDPLVMSNFGMLMIIVWGFLFLAVYKNYEQVKYLVAVFVLEKLVYVCAWIRWFLKSDLQAVYEKDIIAGMFFSVYGLNDFLFMIFFAMVFFQIGKKK